MIVAIDGPAGSGKSTAARALAASHGYRYIDTGAMYRAVALCALDNDVSLDNAGALAHIAVNMDISFGSIDADTLSQKVFLDGVDVSEQIRSKDVTVTASNVAKVPEVREALVARQRELTDNGVCVFEGRDIGTVVFPEAVVKVFLEASPEARALRRCLELYPDLVGKDHGDIKALDCYKDIYERIAERDKADRDRSIAPLRPATDAHVIDSSHMTLEQVVKAIFSLVQEVA